MTDSIDKKQRSELMAKVRRTGNKSTEKRVEQLLKRAGLSGWTKHAKDIAGHPDFYFPKAKLALFVDGCFWHACPRCGRLPKSRRSFWRTKIEANRLRDLRIIRLLRRTGYRTQRVWEHAIDKPYWLNQVKEILNDLEVLEMRGKAGSRKTKGRPNKL